MALVVRVILPRWFRQSKGYNMNWYESFLLTPVRALNEIRSNVWSVMLIITGITLLLHGHENAGSSLITGAFAVFRSSNTETAPVPAPPVQPNPPVTDPNVKR